MKRLLLLIACVMASQLLAAPPGWTTDYNQAVEQAKAEKKTLFLNFTTVGKNPETEHFNKEILGQEAFSTFAKDKLVLVDLVMRPKSSVKPDDLKRNEALAKRYGVSNLPAVVLVDTEGKKLGEAAYAKGGAGPFIEKVTKILEKKP